MSTACPTATIYYCPEDDGPCGMYCPKSGVLLNTAQFGKIQGGGGAVSGNNTTRQATSTGQEEAGSDYRVCYQTDQGYECVSTR